MWVLYLEWEHSKAQIGNIPTRTLIFFMALWLPLVYLEDRLPPLRDWPSQWLNAAVGNHVLQESKESGMPPLRGDRLLSSLKKRVSYAPWHVPTPSHIAGPRCHRGLAERKFQHQLALADVPKPLKNKTQAMTVRMEWWLKMDGEAFPWRAWA